MFNDGIMVEKIDSHRNGVFGNCFNVIKFKYTEGGETTDLLAVVFPDAGNVAVLSPNDLSEHWRGDWFESDLRKAIEDFWTSIIK